MGTALLGVSGRRIPAQPAICCPRQPSIRQLVPTARFGCHPDAHGLRQDGQADISLKSIFLSTEMRPASRRTTAIRAGARNSHFIADSMSTRIVTSQQPSPSSAAWKPPASLVSAGVLSVATFALGMIAAQIFSKSVPAWRRRSIKLDQSESLGTWEERQKQLRSAATASQPAPRAMPAPPPARRRPRPIPRISALEAQAIASGHHSPPPEAHWFKQGAQQQPQPPQQPAETLRRSLEAEELLAFAHELYCRGTSVSCVDAKAEAYKALAIATEVKDIKLQMQAYAVLSDVCEMQMDAKSQLAYAEELLKLAAKARDREMEMLGNLAKGNALGHLGQHGLAVSHQRLASKIAKEIGDQSTAGRTYGALGMCYYELGELEEASKYMQKSQEIFLKLGDKESLAVAYMHTGEASRALGDLQAAKQYQMKALELAQRLGKEDLEGHIMQTMMHSHSSNLKPKKEAVQLPEIPPEHSQAQMHRSKSKVGVQAVGVGEGVDESHVRSADKNLEDRSTQQGVPRHVVGRENRPHQGVLSHLDELDSNNHQFTI
eukprot:CAMPEP_0114253146 /NCGR_PEP_ID=MMETSP0058-20121206/16231_1 /TAXON_ID=36894 /ORGANISM="Pyramimonas parkeae, CCMP726" /LENGTH=546 /DNA_ID=CAMNT_0001367161 /DNA_START=446 /DNA_END=2086 /DNA_ORIENTATION=+